MYNKLMTKEVYSRFQRAAEAWAEIDPPVASTGLSFHDRIVAGFFERYSDAFSYDSCYIPERFIVVYLLGSAFENQYAVVSHPCEKSKVRLTSKFIEFEDGRRVHRSKIFFLVY